MQEFSPRILLPGTPGIPAHMAVAHDARVYDEFANPAYTTVVYVPKWSPAVQNVFAQLAAIQPDDIHKVKCNAESMTLDAYPDSVAVEQCREFLADQAQTWIQGFLHRPCDREVVREIAANEYDFIRAAGSLKASSQRIPDILISSSPRILKRRQEWNWSHDTNRPDSSYAHTDDTDNGIFTFPVGTVLVDQAGLDLRELEEHNQIGTTFLRLSQLPNRSWQLANGSFALWRSSQYHFHPMPERDILRYTLIARPQPVMS